MSELNINRVAADSETQPPEQNEEIVVEQIRGFFPASVARAPLAGDLSEPFSEDLLDAPAEPFLEGWDALNETQVDSESKSDSQSELEIAPELTSSAPSLLKSLRPSLLGLLALIAGVSAIGYYNSRQAIVPLAAEPSASPSLTAAELYESDIFPELKQQALLAESLAVSPAVSEGSESPVEAEPIEAEIVGAAVELRARPSLKSEVVVQAKQGESYLVTGRLEKVDDLQWVELKVKEDLLAWVSQSALKLSRPLPSPTPEPRGQSAADKLLLEDGFAWLNSPEEVQLVTGKALVSEIFKDQPDQISLENLVKLNACLTASAQQDDLTEMKVYQLASACALAMKWR